MANNFKKKIRRMIAATTSALLMLTVATPVEAQAQGSPYDPLPQLSDAYAYGYGGLLDLRLLHNFLTIGPNGRALSAAELRGVDQLWETAVHDGQSPRTSTIDLQALELIYVNLGAISLPLVGQGGLLELVLNDASVGVLREYAHAPSAITAQGAAGVVSDSGGLEITRPGSGKNAEINLLSLLNLQGSSLITDNVLSTAALELGAVSAVAIKPDTSELDEGAPLTCDPNLRPFNYGALGAGDLSGDPEVLADEDGRICSGYQVADARVVIDSPAVESVVGDLQSTLTTLLGGVESTLNGLLGSQGVLDDIYRIPVAGPALKALVDVSVEVELPAADITAALLADPLKDSTGLVSVDLSTGQVNVDLRQLHGGNLNDLPPNTSLLTAAQLSQITDTVTNLLTAPKEQEPYGLNARLDRVLRGENQRGGLYATELSINTCVLGLPGVCTAEADITATLGGLLTGAKSGTQAQYAADPYSYYYVDGTLGRIVTGVIGPLLGGIGGIVEGLLFGSGTGLLGGLLGDLQAQVLSPLLATLNPVLTQVLDPIANIIINRQTLRQVEHGAVFTVSALEVNVLDLGTSGEVIHLPLATASVMAQHWKPIDLNLNVAKIGDGRDLHTPGYAYDLVCTADNWSGIDEKDLAYGETQVGTGFSYSGNQLSLMDAPGGLAEPLRVLPGATCTVTASPALDSDDALRPTGDTPTRTPYTYFLGTNDVGVVVSGETPADEPTAMTLDRVSVEDGRVKVDAAEVGDEWKNHSFTFVVPLDAEAHTVNIVHAYDIDTRDIVVTKTVTGDDHEDETFAFGYSLDAGATWHPGDPDMIGHEGSFIIRDVPVLDAELNPSEVRVREALGSDESGPVVSWNLDGTTLDTNIYGEGFATVSFVAGPVAAVPTPNQELGVGNSYAQISVDKHIDGPLDFIGSTTLLSFGADKMTISYTVRNDGDVDLDTIRIYDPSLVNELFTLPSQITVDPVSGEVSGCALTFGADGEDASCSFEVTFDDPEAPFRYETDTAVVDAEATTVIDGREIKATATDKHGAMRLSDLLGMLPSTGVTTLVWILGLGLLIALAALTVYVRSRRK